MTVDIGDRSVPPGERAWVELEVVEDADMRPVTLQVCVVNGAADGPTLWVQGNVHGDEAAGALAVRDALLGLDPVDVTGAVVGVPVANPVDFLAKRRGAQVNFHGRTDAGRVFPGSPDGSFPQQLAHALAELVAERADAVVSVHTADKEVTVRPGFAGVAAGASGAAEEARGLARAAGFPAVVAFPADAVTGFLFARATATGVPGVMLEAGTGARPEPWAVDAHREGIGRVARAAGVLPGDAGATSPAVYDNLAFLVAHAGGFVELDVEPEDAVEAGEALGGITNLRGERVETLRAPHDAVVAGVRTYPVARPGDTVVELLADEAGFSNVG